VVTWRAGPEVDSTRVATDKDNVVRGPGPPWFRHTCVALAVIYLIALVKHPGDHIMIKNEPRLGWLLRPTAFFTQSTSLFPFADKVITEFRLEGWVCASHRWEPLDPRPYFPIEADDKESRFQRLGYFYRTNRTVMQALDEFITVHHNEGGYDDDGIQGTIGGIRLSRLGRPIPEPGDDVPRYHYEPLSPIPPDENREGFHTTATLRKSRCPTI
jgi:hypothetical protein